MEFEVLGPIRVCGAAGVVEPAGHLRRVLLGMLLVRANESVPADVLADAMWGDLPDDRTGQRLQLHVHKLRRTLSEPSRLSFGAAGYRLTVLPGELDAERFISLVAEARATATDDPRRCAELVRKALALWRGTPYPGLDIPALVDEAERLAECRLTALEMLYRAELASGRHTEVVAELTDLARRHPLREQLQELLMLALHRCGRQADALAVYRETRRALVDELGIEPGPALRQMEQRILTGVSDPVPAQLPHKVCGFVGRAAELSEMDSAVARVSIAALTGTAGVGKTALAVHWAHLARDRFPDGQLYMDLRGYGPEEPVCAEDALACFLRALGVEGAGIPQGLSERSARFRTLMAGRRMLVLLDNARTVEQVRPLLPGAPTTFALVTSRDSLAGLVARDGAHRVAIDRLPADESLDLLRVVAGDTGTAPDAAGTLIEMCARLPLALRIAGELLRAGRGGNVAELVAELADEQRRLDLFDSDGDPHTAVRSVFSWSYQHLPAAAARVFRLLSLHPGHDVDAYALAALSECDLRTTRRALDTLVRAHLVDETSAGRFQQHDLLRAYAAELAGPAALTRLYDYYQHTAKLATDFLKNDADMRPATPTAAGPVPTFKDVGEAVRWLDAERYNLLAVAEHAARNPDSHVPTNLSTILWRYLDIGGYHDEAAALHTLAITVARQHRDIVEEASALRLLSATNRRLGNMDQSISHIEQSLALSRKAGNSHLEAAALTVLGANHLDTGRLRTAAVHFEQANALREELGAAQHNAINLTNLGNVRRLLGDYQRADELIHQAIAYAEDMGSQNVTALGLFQLAELRADQNLLDEARELAERVLFLVRGSKSREGHALATLGRVHRKLGNPDEALTHLRCALTIARTIGECNLIVKTLNLLGETHVDAGNPAQAIALHSEAIIIVSASDDRIELANAHAALGNAHATLGNDADASHHWRAALAAYRDLGMPQAAEVAARLSGPADVSVEGERCR